MTLLSLSKDAADEIGIERPSSVVGSSQPAVQKLLRYANRVGRTLMKKVPWQILRASQSFVSIAAETQTGILPTAFDRFIPETFWDQSAGVLIAGPISATEWAGLKGTSYNGNPKFYYRGGAVLITPTLAAGKTLAFEYVSKNWCQSSGAVGQTAWAADTDTGVLDEELMTLGIKYVYLTDEGLPNAIAAAEFDDYFNALLANDQPDAGILAAADIFGSGRHFTGAPPTSGASTLLG